MIARTTDYRKVKHIAPWAPIISSEMIYLLDDDRDLWTFHKYKDGAMIHADLLKRGKAARESAKRAFAWIFENTEHETIYAELPIENRRAAFMCAWSGMKFTHKTQTRRCYEVKKYGIH